MLPALLLLAAAAREPYSGPLLDAHTHIWPPQSNQRPRDNPRDPREHATTTADELLAMLRDRGVEGVCLMGPAVAAGPPRRDHADFFFSFSEVPRDQRTRALQFSDEILADIEQQLDGGFRGVGEVSLRHFQPPGTPDNPTAADDARMLAVYDLAARRRVPVTVHVEREYADELSRACAHNRECTIVWAHGGDAAADVVRRMIRENDNLCADLSCRHPYWRRHFPPDEQSLADDGGRLKPEWRDLFEEFPDRFLFGLDLGTAGREGDLDRVIPFYRGILGDLSPETAEKIAHLNARRILRLDEEPGD